MGKLLTTKEVADILKLSEQTIAQWRSEGRGPEWLKIVGVVRYEEEAVRSWIESIKSETTLND